MCSKKTKRKHISYLGIIFMGNKGRALDIELLIGITYYNNLGIIMTGIHGVSDGSNQSMYHFWKGKHSMYIESK